MGVTPFRIFRFDTVRRCVPKVVLPPANLLGVVSGASLAVACVLVWLDLGAWGPQVRLCWCGLGLAGCG